MKSFDALDTTLKIPGLYKVPFGWKIEKKKCVFEKWAFLVVFSGFFPKWDLAES